MKKISHTVFYVIFFFLQLILVFSCTNQVDDNNELLNSSEEIPVSGGIYHAPLSKNPVSLDPVYVQGVYGITLIHQIFDGLVRFDSNLSISPGIAKTWKIQDHGKLYRFTLRKNVRFHNQTILTASDVEFTLKRLLKADPAPAILPHLLKIEGATDYRQGSARTVKGLEIENDNNFNIRLTEPHVPFLTSLGMYQASIVPKEEVNRLGKEFGKKPLGAGPFKLALWDEKETIRLLRFNNYYLDKPHLDGIQYKIYPKDQDEVSLLDFKNGNLDELVVFPNIRKALEENKSLQWFHRPSLSLFFYGMNIKHPNLQKPNLRKALSAAINRQVFVDKVYNGQFEPAKTILPPGMPGYNLENQTEDDNLEMAHKYLSSDFNHHSNSITELEIVAGYQTPRVEVEMNLIKNFWAKIGVKIKEKYITDWTEFENYLKSDEVQIYRYAWFADIPDPDSFLYSLFASESPSNYAKLANSEIDSKLSEARGIIDPVKRAKMYQEIESLIMEYAPIIPLFYLSEDRVYQPYVKSVKISALGAAYMKLNKIWLDKPSNESNGRQEVFETAE